MLFLSIILFFIKSVKVPIYLCKIISLSNPSIQYDSISYPFCQIHKVENFNFSFSQNFIGLTVNDIGLYAETENPFSQKLICQKGMSQKDYIYLKDAILQNLYIQFLVDNKFLIYSPLGVSDQSGLLYYSIWKFRIEVDSSNNKVVSVHVSGESPANLRYSEAFKLSYKVAIYEKNKLPNLVDLNGFNNNIIYRISWEFFYSLLILSVNIFSAIILVSCLGVFKFTNSRSDQESLIENNDNSLWKSIRGDVFRKPANLLLLSSLVGISLHFLLSFVIAFLSHIIFIFIFSLFSFDNDFSEGIIYMLFFFLVYLILLPLPGFVCSSFFSLFGEKESIDIKQFVFFSLLIFIPILLFIKTWGLCLTNTFEYNILFLISFLLFLFSILTSIFILYYFKQTQTKKSSFLSFLTWAFFGSKFNIAAIPQKLPKLSFILNDFILLPLNGYICSYVLIHHLKFIIFMFFSNEYIPKITIYYCLIIGFDALLISAILSIVITCILIFKGFYYWQWKSFLYPFFSSFFIFSYLLIYMKNNSVFLNIKEVISLISLFLLISIVYGLFCGTIGFFSAYYFIRILYSLS